MRPCNSSHTALQIKEPLLLVHYFMRTQPELLDIARVLFRLTALDYLPERATNQPKASPYALIEYLSEQRATEVMVAAN